jgi:hypothetical protein
LKKAVIIDMAEAIGSLPLIQEIGGIRAIGTIIGNTATNGSMADGVVKKREGDN